MPPSRVLLAGPGQFVFPQTSSAFAHKLVTIPPWAGTEPTSSPVLRATRGLHGGQMSCLEVASAGAGVEGSGKFCSTASMKPQLQFMSWTRNFVPQRKVPRQCGWPALRKKSLAWGDQPLRKGLRTSAARSTPWPHPGSSSPCGNKSSTLSKFKFRTWCCLEAEGPFLLASFPWSRKPILCSFPLAPPSCFLVQNLAACHPQAQDPIICPSGSHSLAMTAPWGTLQVGMLRK